MIIAVDFDGTIAQTDFPVIHEEIPDDGEVLRRLHDSGHYLILWTCRTGENLLCAVNWLLEHNIHFDRINDHNPDNSRMYGAGAGVGAKKVYAHLYIDDKQVGGLPAWNDIYEFVRQKEEEYLLKKG